MVQGRPPVHAAIAPAEVHKRQVWSQHPNPKPETHAASTEDRAQDAHRYTQRSRPPEYTSDRSGAAASAHTLSVCTANACRQRCWPRSHRRSVWSLLPDTASVPSSFSSSALPPG